MLLIISVFQGRDGNVNYLHWKSKHVRIPRLEYFKGLSL